MSDQIDISRGVCNEMAFRLHRMGEYDVVQLEGYSLWPFADMILALRAALDAAEAEQARAVEAERERCAALADAMWGEGPSGSYDSGATQDGFNIATQRIAAAIRTGAKP
jgi:hypothetical protein